MWRHRHLNLDDIKTNDDGQVNTDADQHLFLFGFIEEGSV